MKTVKIIGGAFNGFTGKVINVFVDDYMRVEIELFGKKVEVEIPMHDLEKEETMHKFDWAGVKFGSYPSDCGPEEAPYPYVVCLTEGSKTFQKNTLVAYAEQAGLVICQFKRDEQNRPIAMMRQPYLPGETPGKAKYLS
jgi:hypothetical protein